MYAITGSGHSTKCRLRDRSTYKTCCSAELVPESTQIPRLTLVNGSSEYLDMALSTLLQHSRGLLPKADAGHSVLPPTAWHGGLEAEAYAEG